MARPPEGVTWHGYQTGTRCSCRVGRCPHYRRRASRAPAQARSGSPQATAAICVAPALRCDAGLAAHVSANGDLRQPARPPQRQNPPLRSHPAPVPPPKPPPVQHSAPPPPPQPQPPPELEPGESDDENWALYHLSTPPVVTFVPAATARRAASPLQQPPPTAEPTRRRGARWYHLNLRRWFPNARTGAGGGAATSCR